MSELAFVNDYLAPRKTIRGVIVSEDYSKRVAPDEWRGRKALAEKPGDLVAAGSFTAADLREALNEALAGCPVAGIVIEQPQAIVARRAASDLALELIATVRNDTGRIIKGLEVRGAVVDSQGSPLSERVAVIIPTQQTAIEPNEAIRARLLLEGLRPEPTHAGVRLEVTGVIFD